MKAYMNRGMPFVQSRFAIEVWVDLPLAETQSYFALYSVCRACKTGKRRGVFYQLNHRFHRPLSSSRISCCWAFASGEPDPLRPVLFRTSCLAVEPFLLRIIGSAP